MRRRPLVLCLVSSAFTYAHSAWATESSSFEEAEAYSKQTDEQVAEIIGGVRSKSCHWPSAPIVNLRGEICTGSLVHPEIVVTAGHCNNGITTVTFTDSRSTSTPQKYGVEYCKSHPQWRSESASLGKHVDFSFCKLKKPVTGVQITPVMMGCELEYVKPGAEIYAVGFGKTVGNNPRTVGTKYQVKTTFNRFSSENNGEAVIGSQGKGSCHGDSGGPLYAKLPESKYGKDAGWRVFGVTSWGNNSCPGPANYGMLHKFVPFIEKTSGIDITPCTDADGTWNPTEACKGAPLDPFKASGTWANGCEPAPAGGFIASCGDPFGGTDEEAPEVSIKSPKADAEFEFDETVEVTVSAKDNEGVVQVDLLVDGKSAGPLDKEPYAWTLEDLKPGEHSLVAVAKDEAGNEAKTEELSFEVKEEPKGDPTPDETTGDDSQGGEDQNGEDSESESESDSESDSESGESDSGDDTPGGDDTGGGGGDDEPSKKSKGKGDKDKDERMSSGRCDMVSAADPVLGGASFFGLLLLVRRRKSQRRH